MRDIAEEPAVEGDPARVGEFEIDAKLDAIAEGVEAAVGWAARHWCADEDRLGDVKLGVSEAVNNIVLHGHRGGEDAPIRFRLETARDTLLCRISDTAPAPPAWVADRLRRQAEAPDAHALPEGGFGLYIICRCTERARLAREGRWNHLTLAFAKGGR